MKSSGNLIGIGFILLEDYINDQGRNNLSTILFRNRETGVYENPGGGIDKGEIPILAAQRELQEESNNLFHLNLDDSITQNYIQYKNYNAYFVKITSFYPINLNWYYYNHYLIMNRHAPIPFTETDAAKRFYISDLLRCDSFNDNDCICPDTEGNLEMVYGKTINCIYQGVKEGIFTINTKHQIGIHQPEIFLYPHLNYRDSRHPFLNGTKWYTSE